MKKHSSTHGAIRRVPLNFDTWLREESKRTGMKSTQLMAVIGDRLRGVEVVNMQGRRVTLKRKYKSFRDRISDEMLRDDLI